MFVVPRFSRSGVTVLSKTLVRNANPYGGIGKRALGSTSSEYRSRSAGEPGPKVRIGLLAGVAAVGAVAGWRMLYAYARQDVPQSRADEPVAGLPEYSAEDVALHDNTKTRIWISYKCGVYDVTDFVEQHPGGDNILLGAGGDIEPFWNLYAVHKTPEIFGMLEAFRIGNLRQSDVGVAAAGLDDPYATDPKRHAALKPSSAKPFNAEPPLSILADSYHTPK